VVPAASGASRLWVSQTSHNIAPLTSLPRQPAMSADSPSILYLCHMPHLFFLVLVASWVSWVLLGVHSVPTALCIDSSDRQQLQCPWRLCVSLRYCQWVLLRVWVGGGEFKRLASKLQTGLSIVYRAQVPGRSSQYIAISPSAKKYCPRPTGHGAASSREQGAAGAASRSALLWQCWLDTRAPAEPPRSQFSGSSPLRPQRVRRTQRQQSRCTKSPAGIPHPRLFVCGGCG
jgi:hypothetical protein